MSERVKPLMKHANFIKSIFAAVAFCAALSLYADTETADGITWRYQVSDGKATIYNNESAAISPLTTGAITIPSSLGGYPVTSIGDDAFFGCSGLESVTIPDSVTSIGDYAFVSCVGLTSVTIPGGVKNIGRSAFSNCEGLADVVIEDGVTSIGDKAFLNCSNLATVTIPQSVADLSTTAFDGCGRLWTSWYKTLANSSAGNSGSGTSGGGGSSGVVQIVDAGYALTNSVADRAIASVTVDCDCAIDEFVLKDGKVYDTVVRIVNTSDASVKLTLPEGYEYETFKGAKPLTIPANSRNLLTITRTADKVFLVSRRELETVQ